MVDSYLATRKRIRLMVSEKTRFTDLFILFKYLYPGWVNYH